MTPLAWISERLEMLRGRLLLLAPAALGTGVAGYFALPVEPTPAMWSICALIALASIALGWLVGRGPYVGLGSLAVGVGLIVVGGMVGGLRTELVRAPVLDFRYYGLVEGRVLKVDRSQSDAVRVLLDQVRLARVWPDEMPERVRISLHGPEGYSVPEPGMRVATTAFLSGPEGPVEPGGFDFRRMAWFDRIGALGYTRVPVLTLRQAEPGLGPLVVHRLRSKISAAVQAAIPGEAGGFAAAVTTGDRAAMHRDTVAALRGSNLAHLLAISGLHMGLLTAFVFAALRYGLALVPNLALLYPVRKIAAIGALQAGAFYLALSGGNVATERAFIMVAVMFGAVLLDRRALTLRAVAIAALLILLARPESITEPGFQMSFAATSALVAVFASLRDWAWWHPPRWARAPLAVILSSAVAGIATAPFAAAHFNQVSHYGLIANFLAVPVMGALVMPLAVIAAVLWPIGLAWLPLWVMQWPIRWILEVAEGVSSLDGALSFVPSPPASVLPMLTVGGLMLIVMFGRLRLLGVVPVVLAFAIWSGVQRPDVLVSGSGRLVGVLTDEGRVLNKPRGEGFVARNWLENDGDPAAQEVAAVRGGFFGEKTALFMDAGNLRLAALSGRGASDRVTEACDGAGLVILGAAVDWDQVPVGCNVLDETRLRETGALAIWQGKTGLRMTSVTDLAGRRPWVRPSVP